VKRSFLIQKYIADVRFNCNDHAKYSPKELEQMKEVVSKTTDEELKFLIDSSSKFENVFSHNDIWTGNILFKENGEVVFCDYEVMDYNFKGYDIGKLLLEVLYERHPTDPEFDLKDFKYFPTEEEVDDFIRYYFITYYGKNESKKVISNVLDENEFKTHWDDLSNYYSKEEITKMMNELKEEVRVGIMQAGYYQFFLGMRIGKSIEFSRMDFIRFAYESFRCYEEFKKRLLASKQ